MSQGRSEQGKDRGAREFSVTTEFQRQARLPGGVPRQRAIADAQVRIENTRPQFPAFLAREVAALRLAVPTGREAERAPADWIEAADACACRLCDVAATLEEGFVAFVADNLRAVFEAMREGAVYHRDVVACHVDALTLAAHRPFASLPPADLAALSEGLKRVLGSRKGPPRIAETIPLDPP